MARISWSEQASRPNTAGVDRGVFFIAGEEGLPWNGLLRVTESSPDVLTKRIFQDGQAILVKQRATDYTSVLEAYTYPPEFEPYSGYSDTVRTRIRPFGLSYRVMTGETSYQIHLLYNVVAKPQDLQFTTIGDSIDPVTFSWDILSRPVKLAGRHASSHIVIDSEATHPWTLEAIERELYGDGEVISHLPTPQEIEQIYQDNAIFKVVDNGDGTATISGPDEAIQMLTTDRVKLDWPSVQRLNRTTYRASSL